MSVLKVKRLITFLSLNLIYNPHFLHETFLYSQARILSGVGAKDFVTRENFKAHPQRSLIDRKKESASDIFRGKICSNKNFLRNKIPLLLFIPFSSIIKMYYRY